MQQSLHDYTLYSHLRRNLSKLHLSIQSSLVTGRKRAYIFELWKSGRVNETYSESRPCKVIFSKQLTCRLICSEIGVSERSGRIICFLYLHSIDRWMMINASATDEKDSVLSRGGGVEEGFSIGAVR